MRTTRLHIPQPLREGTTLVASGPSAHHVKNVLRLRPGAALRDYLAAAVRFTRYLADLLGDVERLLA